MLVNRLMLVCLVLIILQNNFLVAHAGMTSWTFRKTLIEKLRNTKKNQSSKNDVKVVSLFERLSSFWRNYNEKLDSFQNTEVKPFRPFFDGRFGR